MAACLGIDRRCERMSEEGRWSPADPQRKESAKPRYVLFVRTLGRSWLGNPMLKRSCPENPELAAEHCSYFRSSASVPRNLRCALSDRVRFFVLVREDAQTLSTDVPHQGLELQPERILRGHSTSHLAKSRLERALSHRHACSYTDRPSEKFGRAHRRL